MAKNTKVVASFCFQMFSHYRCDSVVALFILTQQAVNFARCRVQIKIIPHDTHHSPFI